MNSINCSAGKSCAQSKPVHLHYDTIQQLTVSLLAVHIVVVLTCNRGESKKEGATMFGGGSLNKEHLSTRVYVN